MITRKVFKVIFALIFIWSAFHLVRDIFQFFGVHNIIADIAARDHKWCVTVGLGLKNCNFTSLPQVIFNLFAIPIVLKRKRSGFLGIFIFISTLSVLVMWLIP